MTARPCPTTCSPRATGYVPSVSVLHSSVIRPASGKRVHRAPNQPTMEAVLRRLTAGWARRTSAVGHISGRSLSAIRSQLWCLHRVRTSRSFSAGGRCSQARPPRHQGPGLRRNSYVTSTQNGTHFSRRSPRTTLRLVQNWRKSLTCYPATRMVQGDGQLELSLPPRTRPKASSAATTTSHRRLTPDKCFIRSIKFGGVLFFSYPSSGRTSCSNLGSNKKIDHVTIHQRSKLGTTLRLPALGFRILPVPKLVAL